MVLHYALNILFTYIPKTKTIQPNYPPLILKRKRKKKKKTRRGFGVLMVVGGLYNKSGDPLDSSFSLFQMFFQSQVFYFGNI